VSFKRLADEHGQSTIEYGLVIALVASLLMLGLSGVASAVGELIVDITNVLSGVM
jgi:Flp pilus assembly pilin Flp